MGQATPTEIEVNMVKTAPLAYELQAAGDEMVKLIKQAPPDLQPLALGAALAVVAGFQATADAAAQQLPDFPASLSVQAISAEVNSLEQLYSGLPDNSPATVFDSGLQLVSEVDDMVSPITTDTPTVPHQLTTTLINRQAELLMKYITDQTLSG